MRRAPAARRELYGYITKREPSTPLPRDVTKPPPFDESDRGALVALRDGTAAPHQQQRALGWVLYACGHNDRLLRSDARDDAIVLARHSIAEAIMMVLATRPRKEGG